MNKSYQCPDCLQSVSTSVNLSTLPAHKCQAKADKLREMPEVDEVVPIPEGWRWAQPAN